MKLFFPARPKSIAGRLLIFSGIFVTLALVVASAILWLALNAVIREQIDQRLDTQIGALASAVTHGPDGRLELSTILDAPPFDRPGSGWYWQVEGTGQRLASHSLLDGTIDAPPPRQDFLHMLTAMPTPGEGRQNGRKLYLRQSSRDIDGEMVLITVTAPEGALVDPAVRALFWLVPCMLLLGVVLLAGTLWQIRFGLRPLKSMAAGIDAINRGEQSRLQDEATVELAPLASKTNALIQANAERLAATRIQFANLAHGLKTPVASLLLALDGRNDPDGALRDLALRIDNRIKHHLSSARRVMASSGTVARTEVAKSLADIHGAISLIHAERGIAFKADVTNGLAVACEESDVEEMLGNLMDNAFKWASSRVTAVAVRDGAFVRITFEDDGPGIPQERIKAVLLPGVREDERVPGDGFGLTIVTEMAGLYGGSLVLEPASPTGLRAILRLPAAVYRA
ncbi:HAMP domain-containing histidine kinase (plasmid) [Rhizobium sp. B230/85]|uniref:sensor histidine kinase n=1 Tax=unclassified Rhizobium TaxID=2613769 RepID=UPI001ADA4E60|nr:MULTISPECIES: HAMP domain-containing sensor histidine kinase [unclassified Rhizobium]MBO9136141.1 HAMP domain-containing histidine kinase [Rhizobium sp. B209b/85]QXZ99263.1 HAMP domain-containing histidine kinase [Rhizobium sp. B230/85]